MYESKLQEDKEALDEQRKELSDLEAKPKARLEEEEKQMKERVERDIEEMKAKIKAEKKKWEEEKSQWEEEKEEVKKTKTFEKIVTLNVGGTKYTTSLSTLTKYPDSMLGVMFSGRHALPQQEDGSYFVDVDGEYFRYILSYLRDRDHGMHILSELTAKDCDHVEYLIHYFQFQELETVVLLNKRKHKATDTYRRRGYRPLEIVEMMERYCSIELYINPLPNYNNSVGYAIDYEVEIEDKTQTCTLTCPYPYQEANIQAKNYQKVEFLGKIERCNLTDVQFLHCHFGEGFSFEGSILHNTVFEYCSGLVTNKVHFAPWQVSQAKFQPELLKALKDNGCVY